MEIGNSTTAASATQTICYTQHDNVNPHSTCQTSELLQLFHWENLDNACHQIR